MLTVFNKMKALASEILQGAEKGQQTRAMVLLSATGAEYCAVIKNVPSEYETDEKKLLENLKGDTEITYLLCMWQNGCIDLPPFAFRKLLCELNSKNLDCGIFVMTDSGYSIRKLSNSMK